MRKNKGFCLTNILLSLSLSVIIITLGYITYRDFIETQEIKKAKVEIYELFTTYANKAFIDKKELTIKLDYLKKEITVFEYGVVPIDRVKLPKNLNYITIFEKDTVDVFSGKITKDGNITPSFSIYIFDYDNIAQYRISLYGFDIIKYMRINIYKNQGDRTPKYSNILNFHKRWSNNDPKWVEE